MNKNSRSVNRALQSLFDYCDKIQHRPTHIKLIFDINAATCLIEGTINGREKAAIEDSANLVDDVAYIVRQYISAYQIVFPVPLLSKVYVEADLDSLGMIYKSIKVTCRFKINALCQAFNQSMNTVVTHILKNSMLAEQAELLEDPCTDFTLNFKHGKLRNMDLVISTENMNSSCYQRPLANAYYNAVASLLNSYGNLEQNSSTNSIKICFSLIKRSELQLIKCSVVPQVPLDYDYASFRQSQIQQLMKNTDKVLRWFHQPVTIRSIRLSEHKSSAKLHYYICTLEIEPSDPTMPSRYQYSLTDTGVYRAITDLFTTMVNSFCLKHHSQSSWLNNLYFNINAQTTNEPIWEVKFNHLNIIDRFSPAANQSTIQSAIKQLEQGGQSLGPISCVRWTSKDNHTQKIMGVFEPSTQQSNQIVLDLVKPAATPTNVQLTHTLLAVSGHYCLTQIKYLLRVH